MVYFLLWIGLAVAVGMVATSRNRGSGNWFLVSVVFSPLIGLILLLAMPNLQTRSGTDDTADRIKCPACAELVLPDASVCKHCGTALTADREYSDRMAAQRLQKQRQADNENLAKVAIAVIALLAFVYFWV